MLIYDIAEQLNPKEVNNNDKFKRCSTSLRAKANSQHN